MILREITLEEYQFAFNRFSEDIMYATQAVTEFRSQRILGLIGNNNSNIDSLLSAINDNYITAKEALRRNEDVEFPAGTVTVQQAPEIIKEAIDMTIAGIIHLMKTGEQRYVTQAQNYLEQLDNHMRALADIAILNYEQVNPQPEPEELPQEVPAAPQPEPVELPQEDPLDPFDDDMFDDDMFDDHPAAPQPEPVAPQPEPAVEEPEEEEDFTGDNVKSDKLIANRQAWLDKYKSGKKEPEKVYVPVPKDTVVKKGW